MRRIIISAILIFSGLMVNAQRTAKEVLESEIVKMLQSDRILLSQQEVDCSGDCTSIGLWKNEKQKKKTLKQNEELKSKLLNKFNPPFYINDGIITDELSFINKSIGLIGSYIIRNNDLSVINKDITPTLPVLASGNQTSILNPKNSGSSYVLNYNSTNLFEGNLDANASSDFKEYYQSKLQLNTNLSTSERSRICIGAGVFDNQLALIFDNLDQISASEFEPVYYLWLEHKKGSIQPGDQIIKAFEGLCYFTSKGLEAVSNVDASVSANSAGNYPFVRYDVKSNSDWTSSRKFTTQQSIYNVYMFKQPELTNIPSVQQILNCWDRLKANAKPEYVSNNVIPANAPLLIRVKFGPIPNDEALSSIKLDENFTLNSIPVNQRFIKSVKLITDDPNRISFDNDYCYLIIEVERNESFLTQNFNQLSHIISAQIPFRIYYNNPIGQDTLDIVYSPIEVQTERYPTPISEYELTPIKDDRYYKYQTVVRFNTSNNNITIANFPVPPKVIGAEGLPKDIEQSFIKYLTETSFSLKNLNEFTMTINLPVKNNFFNINQRSHEIVLILEFFASNGTSYKRKLPVQLIAPKDLIDQNSTLPVLIKDNGELLSLLNRNAIITKDITVGDLISKYQSNNKTNDITGLIKELKKHDVLSTSVFGYYYVPIKYIDVTKMKD